MFFTTAFLGMFSKTEIKEFWINVQACVDGAFSLG